MKFLYIALLLVCSCQIKSIKLESLDRRINDLIISEVFKEIKSSYDTDESVIVLNINRIKDKYEIRTSALYKDDFKWYLIDKNDKLFGFTKYEGILVLVFGDSAGKFYQLTTDKQNFKFLKTIAKNKEKEIQESIPEGPIIFEPVVWVYSFDNTNGYNLINKSADSVLLN